MLLAGSEFVTQVCSCEKRFHAIRPKTVGEMSQWISAAMLTIYYSLTCVATTRWRTLVKWWQCSNIGAFTAVLEAAHNGKCFSSHTETTRFIALLSSPIFMSALLCATTHSSLKRSPPLTGHQHHFVVRDSPQRAPCTPHNNTLKPSIRGHLAPGAEFLPPLFSATQTHTHTLNF